MGSLAAFKTQVLFTSFRSKLSLLTMWSLARAASGNFKYALCKNLPESCSYREKKFGLLLCRKLLKAVKFPKTRLIHTEPAVGGGGGLGYWRTINFSSAEFVATIGHQVTSIQQVGYFVSQEEKILPLRDFHRWRYILYRRIYRQGTTASFSFHVVYDVESIAYWVENISRGAHLSYR